MNYQSGPASLFSAIARDIPAQPEPEPTTTVTGVCRKQLNLLTMNFRSTSAKNAGKCFPARFNLCWKERKTSTTSYKKYCTKHDLSHPDEPICLMCEQDDRITALLAAGNALNKALGILYGECIVCDASGELGEQVTGEAMDEAAAVLASWEKLTT
jgi:hypothetical protein